MLLEQRGTLVHARFGLKGSDKYLGITIQRRKTLSNLAPQKNKLAIMENITREVGLNTAGKGICSLTSQ